MNMSIEILEFPLYIKNKSYHVRKNHLWDKLSKEQKQELIFKYIDNISIEVDKKKNVSIKKINKLIILIIYLEKTILI